MSRQLVESVEAEAKARGIDFPAQTPEQKIEMAKIFKEHGNAKFKEGVFSPALFAYNRIRFLVHGLGGSLKGDDMASKLAVSQKEKLTEQQESDIDELLHAQASNRAAIYLKQEKWEKVVTASSEALEKKKTAKAFYRRGFAQLKLNEIDRAIADLTEAEKLDSSDPAIAKYLAYAKQKDESARKKSDKKLRGFLHAGNNSNE